MVATVAAVDNAEVRVVLGTTDGGKEIVLIRKPNCSVRMIAFRSGGELPKQLQGGFSSISSAQQATDSYLAKVEAKEIKVDDNKPEDKPQVENKPKSTGRSSKK